METEKPIQQTKPLSLSGWVRVWWLSCDNSGQSPPLLPLLTSILVCLHSPQSLASGTYVRLLLSFPSNLQDLDVSNHLPGKWHSDRLCRCLGSSRYRVESRKGTCTWALHTHRLHQVSFLQEPGNTKGMGGTPRVSSECEGQPLPFTSLMSSVYMETIQDLPIQIRNSTSLWVRWLRE